MPSKSPGPAAQKEWLGNLEEGKKQAAASNKWLLVFVHQSGQALGKAMMENVLSTPASKAALSGFIKVKIENTGIGSFGYREASDLQVRRYPAIIFFDSKGSELDRFTGYMDEAQLLQRASEAVDPKTNYVMLRDKLKQDPRDVEALYGMGLKHFRRGDFAQAQKYFDQVVQVDPDNLHHFADNLVLREAEQLMNTSQSAKSLQLIEKFRDRFPDSDELDTEAYLRARLLWLTGRKTESLAAYEQFQKDYPVSSYRYQVRDALRALQEPASLQASQPASAATQL